MLKDWKKIDEDTFGELSIQLILQIGYSKNAPQVALARRWAGDRMAILNRGPEIAVIWMAAFHDDDSARQFEDAYRIMLDRERADIPHSLERRANAVLVIAGAIASQTATLAPAVWKASAIGKPPSLPISPPLNIQAARSESLARAR